MLGRHVGFRRRGRPADHPAAGAGARFRVSATCRRVAPRAASGGAGWAARSGWLDRRLNREQRGDRGAARARRRSCVAMLVVAAAALGWLLARRARRGVGMAGRRGADRRGAAGAAQPLRSCRRRRPRRCSSRAGSSGGRDAVRRRSSAAIPTASTSTAWRARRSNRSPRISATAWWRRPSGTRSSACPGFSLYKTANTLDSMIGYRSPRYLAFGWAAARLDDLAQSGAGAARGGCSGARGAVVLPQASGRRAVRGDARRCAKAPLAQCRLARGRGGGRAGPRARRAAPLSAARIVKEPWLGDGRARATPADIGARAEALSRRVPASQATLVLIGAARAAGLALTQRARAISSRRGTSSAASR